MSLPKNSIECKECNILFIPHHHNGKFCSDTCKSKYQTRNYRDMKAKKSLLKYPDGSDPYNYRECPLCGFRSYNLGTHPLSHDMTPSEYIAKYGPVHSQKAMDSMKGNKNPWHNHGGKLSPFSEKFVKYNGLPENEMLDRITNTKKKSVDTKNINNNDNTKIEYYTSRGMTIEEANIALSDRQRTFSLEICINKYGENEGREIWSERQLNWQNTLSSKSPQDIESINRSKSAKINFKSLWNKDLTDPGNFYIIQISENKYKIGITSKSTIYHRYHKEHLSKYNVLLFESVDSIKHAFYIEQLLKYDYKDTIRKNDYGVFGWTEVIEESDISNLMTKYNHLLSKDYCENLFKETYKR